MGQQKKFKKFFKMFLKNFLTSKYSDDRFIFMRFFFKHYHDEFRSDSLLLSLVIRIGVLFIVLELMPFIAGVFMFEHRVELIGEHLSVFDSIR